MSIRTKRTTFMRTAGWVAGLAMVMGLSSLSPAVAAAEPAAGATGPAATELVTLPDGSTFDPAVLTDADWETAIDELVASDLERTVSETPSATNYVFDVPVDATIAPDGIFKLSVSVPKTGSVQPRLGAGTDAGGLYLLFNNFDQNMLVGGAATAVAASLCALPAVGWVSCAAITTATIAANVWISQNGLCPQNLKFYVVSAPNVGHRCVKY